MKGKLLPDPLFTNPALVCLGTSCVDRDLFIGIEAWLGLIVLVPGIGTDNRTSRELLLPTGFLKIVPGWAMTGFGFSIHTSVVLTSTVWEEMEASLITRSLFWLVNFVETAPFTCSEVTSI